MPIGALTTGFGDVVRCHLRERAEAHKALDVGGNASLA
jgi:hypothetical protein